MNSRTSVPPSLQVEVVSNGGDGAPSARGRLDSGAEYVGGEVSANPVFRHVIDIDGEQLANGISNISAVIGKAMEKATPDAWSVEFNVGFKAGLKVPVLLSGEANAALKVTLSWKSSKATE